MIGVDVDGEKIHRNYRPVTEEVVLEYLEMPTAGDSDVTDDEINENAAEEDEDY